MATVELTEENFAATITDNETVLVDFWASWCGPCLRFGPVYEKVSEAHPDVVFGKLDTEAYGQLAGALQIQAIPTLMAFRGGVLVYREAGAMNAAGLEQLVGAVAALDVDEVRRQATPAAEAAEAGETGAS